MLDFTDEEPGPYLGGGRGEYECLTCFPSLTLLVTLGVSVMSRLRRLFFLGGSCDPGVFGVRTSVWFGCCCRAPEVCCLVERELCRGEATDTLGGFCRMVTSSVAKELVWSFVSTIRLPRDRV